MRVTIKDVAKRAGVSPSTVSRVISNSSKISGKTKEKVRKVMEEMNYHINQNARNLVQQSTQTIGIVMKRSAKESFHDPFFPEVLRGISAWCHRQDYSISLTTGESEEAIFQEVVKMVQRKKVDGIIVSYSKKEDRVVPYLLEHNFPFVVIGKPLGLGESVTYVDNDNVQAARDATEFLIGKGHEDIAYIGGSLQFEVEKYRLQGFKEAILLNGLGASDDYLHHPEAPEFIKDAVKKLMQLKTPPTAIVAIDDLTALNILLGLRENRVRVPEDVSIIGFNNTMISAFSYPSLTSIDTQVYQLGYEAAKCVIEEIKHPSQYKKNIIIPTVLVERESTMEKN